MINFKLPERKPVGKKDKHSIRSLTAWLESLDYRDKLGSWKSLHALIKELNRGVYGVNERYELCSFLNPVLEAVISEVGYKCSSITYPLSERHKAFADYIQLLNIEAAYSYKIIVSEIVGDQALLSEHMGKLLPRAIAQAITYSANLLVERYQIYLAELSHVWYEINQLYLLAERLGLSDYPFSKDEALIIERYKRIVILSLADPYSLMQCEVKKVYALTEEWQNTIDFLVVKGQVSENIHLVDLGADKHPCVFKPAIHQPPQEARIIYVTNLVRDIQQRLTDSNEGDPGSTFAERMQQGMLKRLLTRLTFKGERQSERVTDDQKIVMAIGLGACHYFLSGEKRFNPHKRVQSIETKTKRHLSDISLEEIRLVAKEDEKDFSLSHQRFEKLRRINPFVSEDMIVGDAWQQIFSDSVASALEKETGTFTEQSYHKERWIRRNYGDHGALFISDSVDKSSARVGMLVATQTVEQESYCAFGVIRWMKVFPTKGLIISVMQVAGRALPGAAIAVSGTGNGSDYAQALVVDSSDKDEVANVIVPANLYDVGTKLKLWVEDVIIVIELTEILIETATISKFRFMAIE